MKHLSNSLVSIYNSNLISADADGTTDFVDNLTTKKIAAIDTDDMYTLLKDYGKNIVTAIKLAKKNKSKFGVRPTDIVVLGIGGSAQSGALLASILKYVPTKKYASIRVVRGTEIPKDLTSKTCVFCCSYSGNTEETLLALKEVERTTKNVIVVTSGGKLQKIAEEKKYPILSMPQGMMPRCAMWYSFFHLYFQLLRNGILHKRNLDVLNTFSKKAFHLSLDYSALSNENIALKIAQYINGKIPVIYTAQLSLEAVNLRWKAQFQENANYMCFGNFFPELNHNEINGWMLPNMLDKFVIIAMREQEDGEYINNMLQHSLKTLENNGRTYLELIVEGESLLERIVRRICIADWVSFYLAIINEVNPTPIPMIQNLKESKK